MIIHKIRNFKDLSFLKLYNVKNLLIFEIVKVGNFPNFKFFDFPKMQIRRNFQIANFWNFPNWKFNKFLRFFRFENPNFGTKSWQFCQFSYLSFYINQFSQFFPLF